MQVQVFYTWVSLSCTASWQYVDNAGRESSCSSFIISCLFLACWCWQKLLYQHIAPVCADQCICGRLTWAAESLLPQSNQHVETQVTVSRLVEVLQSPHVLSVVFNILQQEVILKYDFTDRLLHSFIEPFDRCIFFLLLSILLLSLAGRLSQTQYVAWRLQQYSFIKHDTDTLAGVSTEAGPMLPSSGEYVNWRLVHNRCEQSWRGWSIRYRCL